MSITNRESTLLKELARSLLAGQARGAADPHRPLWHLAPAVGLLNDPNGFIQHQGRYHLFYQWNPFACAHGAKFWGHWSSVDLCHWRHEPVALVPSEAYESHGCYSGSAVVNQDKLTLIYTGNVKFADGGRTAWQCLAVENEQGGFDKQGPVLGLPEGYTGHVRDPKVWRANDQWWMVLAAQDQQLQGKVLLYTSADLQIWRCCGELAGSGVNGFDEFGYMWECPDLFTLDDQELLLFCPQGLKPEGERYLNRYQAGFVLGKLDYAQGYFEHGEFHELDLGFECYAPQTTLAEDGRRLLFAWMGVPEQDEFLQPTCAYGWVHCMSAPRELTLDGGRLYQRPARELTALRGDESSWQGPAQSLPELDLTAAEVQLQVSEPFALAFGQAMTLSWDGARLTLSRPSLKDGSLESRYWRGDLSSLTLLFDRSSVEIFINHGEAVMSGRYFPAVKPLLGGQGEGTLALRYWPLRGCMVE